MPKRETSRGFASSQASTLTLSNSTTETTLFSQVIPAGSMGINKKLNLEALCTLTTPVVSIPTLTIRLKLGSAVLTVVSAVGLAVSQTNAPVVIEAKIRNKEASNAQILYAKVTQAGTSLPLLIENSKAVFASWTVDTSVNQTLSITAQFGGLSAATSLTAQDIDIELS